jgi:sugar lactone lactonase YvrE
MKWRANAVCALAAMTVLICELALTIPAESEHTHFWRQSEYSEFQRGTAKGVAIRSDGSLTPAPRFAPFADPNLAYLWALRLDSHGTLFAAGGSNAKVLRFDAKGAPTTVFESPELAAQSILFDAQDNLYVATSPDGKIYKVTPAGQKSTFFDPKTKYIWSLAMDSSGTLFVATGDQGQVYAVGSDGNGKVFYKSDERHARSLALDSKGNLLIGTDPSGLILRVEIQRKKSGEVEAGRSFVLYETDKKEVTSLLAASDGNIYASAIGEKPKTAPYVPPAAPAVVPPVIAGNAQGGLGAAPAAVPPITIPFFPSLGGGSEVYRIAADGSPESIWSSRDDLVYSLGFAKDQRLLLGTGNHGTVIELGENRIFSTVANASSDQVTSLVSGAGGVLYVGTANPGKIFALGPGREKDGSYESAPFDAKIFSQWGRLTWSGENGSEKGKLAFYVRSGNTSRPENNWSDWSGPYSSSGADKVTCPPARFAQWKVVFSQTDDAATPTVSWVSLAYLPKNVAPVIDGIVVQNPGIRIQGFAAPPAAPGTSAPVQIRMPQAPNSVTPGAAPYVAEATSRTPKVEAPPQGVEQKGYMSVVWTSHDDNDDDLTFTLYIRGEGEKNWRSLKDKIDQHHYSWDSTTLPDGAYYLKLVASDSPSNPSDQALSATRESERFEVDNSQPEILNLRAAASKGTSGDYTVTFDVRDPAIPVARAEYSLDSGDWSLIFPKGDLSDSREESYELSLRHLTPGEHTISVRAADRNENVTSSKITITVGGK